MVKARYGSTQTQILTQSQGKIEYFFNVNKGEPDKGLEKYKITAEGNNSKSIQLATAIAKTMDMATCVICQQGI